MIPAYNEESNVERVYERLVEGAGRARRSTWEMIFSVDPSTDRTEELIVALASA